MSWAKHIVEDSRFHAFKRGDLVRHTDWDDGCTYSVVAVFRYFGLRVRYAGLTFMVPSGEPQYEIEEEGGTGGSAGLYSEEELEPA